MGQEVLSAGGLEGLQVVLEARAQRRLFLLHHLRPICGDGQEQQDLRVRDRVMGGWDDVPILIPDNGRLDGGAWY